VGQPTNARTARTAVEQAHARRRAKVILSHTHAHTTHRTPSECSCLGFTARTFRLSSVTHPRVCWCHPRNHVRERRSLQRSKTQRRPFTSSLAFRSVAVPSAALRIDREVSEFLPFVCVRVRLFLRTTLKYPKKSGFRPTFSSVFAFSAQHRL
jgi:hypothetical protein